MKNLKIAITGYGSVSALGSSAGQVWENYLQPKHLFVKQPVLHDSEWMAPLQHQEQSKVKALIAENSKYQKLDPSVHYALVAAREAVMQAGWKAEDNFGINVGSSRGATTLFEKYHEGFIGKEVTDPLSSPTTTLGNIASWVAYDLGSQGPEISHSITCSSALHAVLNGVAWLQSGLSDKFLVGGSEAPLTPFTIAQMKSLKIYSHEQGEFPCRALDPKKKHNSMILGDGASMFCLEREREKALAYIVGIGYGTELQKHNVSISTDAECMQKSMRMAIEGHDPASIDAVILHAPGTIKGDEAELRAVEKVFGAHQPLLTSNKWKIGHTFGASGTLSMEMALLMLQHQIFIGIPYLGTIIQKHKLNKILVNAVGFGGNAVSVLVSKD
ncbi:beta-ketoacyl synthase N-terminal-like domain-containing protein [Solitalea koreensis]|uniref:3-oxoacyl-(Acyl-carrier-protein) synthase n=1 Tax=Solitalea koreensis TaxID=543615 RepID=A0A521D223_9SPHI|nr:beta-ketoacyl synthase N-terminal-like domain-containing protein [Solitalea koreensis]SMO65727.1 3-oxoacyl-(acyl-carrier-protein) synthase [Solitalea koreensis]